MGPGLFLWRQLRQGFLGGGLHFERRAALQHGPDARRERPISNFPAQEEHIPLHRVGKRVEPGPGRIQRLPAEVIRKGRFDQLFFLDLPTDEERRAILAIHIAAHGGDPEQFNLPFLIAATKGWSGAEIEQAIKGAVIKAYAEGRSFTHKDVTWNTARMVPLSRTMEEPIKQLRQWSQTRATPASRKEGAAA